MCTNFYLTQFCVCLLITKKYALHYDSFVCDLLFKKKKIPNLIPTFLLTFSKKVEIVYDFRLFDRLAVWLNCNCRKYIRIPLNLVTFTIAQTLF